MSKLLNKFWNDSIKNSLIAAVIFSFITLGYNLVKAQIDQTNFKTEFKSFWNYEIKLWIVVIAFVLLYLLIHFIINIFNKKFKYDADTLELDRRLFNRIRNELLPNEVMSTPRSNGFASSSFEDYKISFIRIYLDESTKPDFEFFHPVLEQIKLDLSASLEALEYCLERNIFGANVVGWLGVPREWHIEKRLKVIELIKGLENDFCEQYDSLIKNGRNILKI